MEQFNPMDQFARPTITLKLIIQKETQKVLFAECNKNFIDFLFHIPSLPIGNLLSTLEKDFMHEGSLGNLYDCMENFDELYILPKYNLNNRKTLLSPLSLGALNDILRSSKGFSSGVVGRSYPSHYTGSNFCPSHYTGSNFCHPPFNPVQPRFVPPCPPFFTPREPVGYVKDGLYIVMDDLRVEPMSTISFVGLLGELGVTDMTKVEEKLVEFGCYEGAELITNSMITKNVLTNVFLRCNEVNDAGVDDCVTHTDSSQKIDVCADGEDFVKISEEQ